jgi:ATP/maltotriose-dependent transcriptional regulator MalT
VNSGEVDLVRRQHANFFVSYAEQRLTDANLGGPGRLAAHAAIDRERDNLRAALSWCLDERDAEMALRFCRAHWSFWVLRGDLSEGRAWLSRLVPLLNAADAPGMRAVALTFLAGLTWRQGNHAAAHDLYQEALPLFQQANEPWVLASALTGLSHVALFRGNYGRAQAYLEEALPAWRESGDQANVAICLCNQARAAWLQQAFDVARARCEEGLAIARAVGDPWAVSIALGGLGSALLGQGDMAAARSLLDESLTLGRQLGDGRILAYGLDSLGRVATAQGDHTAAQTALRESLRLLHEIGDEGGIPDALDSIATLAAAESQPECAIQLAGAAAGLREAIRMQPSPLDRARVDHWLVPLREALGPEVSARAWERGRAASLEQAVEMALLVTQRTPPRRLRPPNASVSHVGVLSQREQQIAALLVQQLSNRQIAGQLVITERTVATHVEHMLDKLGFASRHQIAAWAAEHGLVT